jgi:DNA-binding transcriptional LysR family regulator
MNSVLDLRRLRHFVAVAEELHFRRAAERLAISQPPLSLSIKSLEQDLEVALFERRRQRVFLTAAGRHLLDRARGILATVETTRQELRMAAGGSGGDLRIGVTASSGLMPFLHRALFTFRQQAPRVRLVLREMPSLAQIEALQQRELDLGIVRKPDTPRGAEIGFRLLCRDALMVAVHEDHPIAALPAVRMRQLRDESFISYPLVGSGTLYQDSLQTLATAGKFIPNVVQEARDSSTIIGLVASGFGVAIVPAALRCIAMKQVRFVALQDASARSALHVAWREEGSSEATKAFQQVLITTAEQD